MKKHTRDKEQVNLKISGSLLENEYNSLEWFSFPLHQSSGSCLGMDSCVLAVKRDYKIQICIWIFMNICCTIELWI